MGILLEVRYMKGMELEKKRRSSFSIKHRAGGSREPPRRNQSIKNDKQLLTQAAFSIFTVERGAWLSYFHAEQVEARRRRRRPPSPLCCDYRAEARRSRGALKPGSAAARGESAAGDQKMASC